MARPPLIFFVVVASALAAPPSPPPVLHKHFTYTDTAQGHRALGEAIGRAFRPQFAAVLGSPDPELAMLLKYSATAAGKDVLEAYKKITPDT